MKEYVLYSTKRDKFLEASDPEKVLWEDDFRKVTWLNGEEMDIIRDLYLGGKAWRLNGDEYTGWYLKNIVNILSVREEEMCIVPLDIGGGSDTTPYKGGGSDTTPVFIDAFRVTEL